MVTFKRPSELSATPTGSEHPAWGRPIDSEDAAVVQAILAGWVRVAWVRVARGQ